MPTFEFFLDSRGLLTKEFEIDVTATLPKVTVQLFDGDTVVDLTGATVTFTLRDAAGAAVVLDAAAVLLNATQGIVEYQLADADVDDVGFFFAQFKITISGESYLIPNDSTQRLRLRIGKEDLPDFSSVSASLPVHAGSHLPGGADAILAMARIKTGTYTGDGTTAQAITGVGFSPKYVRTWERITTEGVIDVFETTPDIIDDNAAGVSIWFSTIGVQVYFRAIISLDADGFTVDDKGANFHPNSDGQVYNYLAIG
ncbi:hypothetical protein LCGC14_1321350 [marine sediment metagenome]|uniref:BppU N-terminal domain-containing protein n=1 Tax=marine sediment metagenome TaxID=412755 RepID=A0A0F9NLU6_9ZZZZ